MRIQRLCVILLTAMISIGLLAGCAPSRKPTVKAPTPPATPPTNTTAKTEQPVAPEKNPPGDIPDTQVFVLYKNTTGKYAVEAPEGWARTEHGADVSFVDKFDGESVKLSKSTTPPTVAGVQKIQAPELQRTGRAVKIQGVKSTTMPRTGSVVYVTYTSNSDPDPVTGKQVRLDNITYYYYRAGTLAALTVWAPTGADNVDQWKRISESFRWL